MIPVRLMVAVLVLVLLALMALILWYSQRFPRANQFFLSLQTKLALFLRVLCLEWLLLLWKFERFALQWNIWERASFFLALLTDKSWLMTNSMSFCLFWVKYQLPWEKQICTPFMSVFFFAWFDLIIMACGLALKSRKSSFNRLKRTGKVQFNNIWLES